MTGGGGGGALPNGILPTIGIGSLPTGALPTTGVGGGGWRVGISAATAALAKVSVEAVTTKNFVMVRSAPSAPALCSFRDATCDVWILAMPHLPFTNPVFDGGRLDGHEPTT
jgi:hypothetical protein